MIYANPHRSRSGRFIRRSRRPVRVHRNPKHLSAAHRRAVSLGVRRALSHRKTGSVSRSVRRKPTMALARRSVRHSVSVVRHRRSSIRRTNVGGFSLHNLLSRENLFLAGGVFTAGWGVGQIVSRYGSKLPGLIDAQTGAVNKWVAVGYSVGIPLAGAYLVRRASPALAKGLVIGSLVSLFTVIYQQVQTVGQVQATGEYLNRQLPSAPPAYSGVRAFGASVYDSGNAFKSDAWARGGLSN